MHNQVYKRRDIAATLVHKAENCGFKAIVLTVDTPRLGRREADIKNRKEFCFSCCYIFSKLGAIILMNILLTFFSSRLDVPMLRNLEGLLPVDVDAVSIVLVPNSFIC